MFRVIDPCNLQLNPFQGIGNDWMLITAKGGDKTNAMTASWGGVGIIWGEPTATCYIRPQRYTYEFMEKNDGFTLSIFSEEYRKALSFCGSKSGRDYDKAKETGLVPFKCEQGIAFEQAEIIINCKKLYVQDMKEDCFLDKSIIDKCYNGDFHRIYVGEITEVLIKE